MLGLASHGSFEYKGWRVGWHKNMLGLIDWAATSGHRTIGDNESGQFGGGTTRGVEREIKNHIDDLGKHGVEMFPHTNQAFGGQRNYWGW